MYDLNFWQDAADSVWSKVEPSAYAQCFTGASISQENWCRRCHLIDHVTDTKPGGAGKKRKIRPFTSSMPTKKRPPPHSKPETCKKYNIFNGDCCFGDACMYQHRCEGCGEVGHPVSRCTLARKGTNTSKCRCCKWTAGLFH